VTSIRLGSHQLLFRSCYTSNTLSNPSLLCGSSNRLGHGESKHQGTRSLSGGNSLSSNHQWYLNGCDTLYLILPRIKQGSVMNHDKWPACHERVWITGLQQWCSAFQRSAWPFSLLMSEIGLLPAVSLHLATYIPVVDFLQMQAKLTVFTTHYKAKHAQHVLDWDRALGTASLVGQFTPGANKLSVGCPSPLATPESGVVFSNEACEKNMGCKDQDCIKQPCYTQSTRYVQDLPIRFLQFIILHSRTTCACASYSTRTLISNTLSQLSVRCRMHPSKLYLFSPTQCSSRDALEFQRWLHTRNPPVSGSYATFGIPSWSVYKCTTAGECLNPAPPEAQTRPMGLRAPSKQRTQPGNERLQAQSSSNDNDSAILPPPPSPSPCW
jgi:hypothetical protein